MNQQLENKLRQARVTAEVGPVLHARLMSRLNAERDTRPLASWGGRWLAAGAAAIVVLGVALVVMQTLPGQQQGPGSTPVAMADILLAPRRALIERLVIESER